MSRTTTTTAIGHAARGATYTVQANPLPYLVPAAASIACLIASGVLSMVWGAHAHPTPWQSAWRSALLLACSTAIVWATWKVGRARTARPELRLMSMLMSATSCAGLWVLTFRGWTFDSVMVYLMVSATACVGLAVTRLMRGDGTDSRPSLFGELADRVKELQDVGKTGRPKVVDGRVITEVEMNPGGDFGQLMKPEVRTAIASQHNVPVGGVRMVPDRRSPRPGRIEISPVDMLENPPAWPGLSSPGGSIAEPLRLAVYQTGKALPLLLPGGEGRNAIGVLVLLGQSGSGKTELQITLAVEARSRVDARVTYIDGRKGKQLPAEFRAAMHTMICDATEGERFLDSLVDLVARRAEQIGGHGHEQWTAGCAKCPPFEVVIVDEASKFIEAEDTLVELAESIRSVGIFMLLGIQRATGDRLPTSVRSTIGGVICMGVKNTAEAGRVLSEETILAGADPGQWQNKMPGALYAELPGVDQEDYSLPARTFRPDRDLVIAELTAYLTAVEQPNEQPAPHLPVPAGEPGEIEEPDEDGGLGEEDDPECPPLQVDPDCPPDEDPRQPLTVPSRPRIELFVEPASGQKFTPAEVRSLFRQAIEQAREQGIQYVKPSSFAPIVDIVGEDGLRPPTITKILKEFCQPGPEQMLRRGANSGVYEVLMPELVGASAT
ncbi:hypothetical protein DQE82_26680 [Micromonospora sp. LHW51205]|uniref:hypothetical protein n=1 Tax=Micromonospora sp. LHW51205 TaxID=2248752 RepID=UPI000DEA5674|nr:hypothetical protein [Micromonospora sp. LHW51205]RBQ05138.1 hypothetical protein DQE82_26680 [Micromonospora sp. LHW51205]